MQVYVPLSTTWKNHVMLQDQESTILTELHEPDKGLSAAILLSTVNFFDIFFCRIVKGPFVVAELI